MIHYFQSEIINVKYNFFVHLPVKFPKFIAILSFFLIWYWVFNIFMPHKEKMLLRYTDPETWFYIQVCTPVARRDSVYFLKEKGELLLSDVTVQCLKGAICFFYDSVIKKKATHFVDALRALNVRVLLKLAWPERFQFLPIICPIDCSKLSILISVCFSFFIYYIVCNLICISM